MNHSHYNPNPRTWIEVKPEKNKLKVLWWRITDKIEDWYYGIKDFISYVKRYKS